MKSGEQKIPVENFRTFTRLFGMDSRPPCSHLQYDALIQALADSEEVSFTGCLADVFERKDPRIFSVGELVRIMALPPSRALKTENDDIRSFASQYGYVAVVTGNGLFGADIYFIAHGALALASATETFSKLSSLR
ncbi:hypothetical protein [Pseudomonas sp. BF-R-12]|uniref:hypothetical protein n=1 Tax=Pseudomonas sp. BF-R-12 TaxID=2832363 RepID=UPI001CBE57E9|nr:hypothetical protein [Pseudomonas sp. BF-R-12]